MTDKTKIPIFILAGGLGTRLSEETHLKPKPMIEIGDIPILVHIMRRYYAFGFNDFVICAGYKSWEIKNYFLTYQFRANHLVIDQRNAAALEEASPYGKNVEQENWRVRVIDTGEHAQTGARLARAFDAISGDGPIEHFGVTYGDGVCDIDLDRELAFHLQHGKTGTVLAVRPMARFGELEIANGLVLNFSEKPEATQGLINGGFFFFKRSFRDSISTNEDCILERDPVSSIARKGELAAFVHTGFWHPMDMLRDKTYLEDHWRSGKAPWLKCQ